MGHDHPGTQTTRGTGGPAQPSLSRTFSLYLGTSRVLETHSVPGKRGQLVTLSQRHTQTHMGRHREPHTEQRHSPPRTNTHPDTRAHTPTNTKGHNLNH